MAKIKKGEPADKAKAPKAKSPKAKAKKPAAAKEAAPTKNQPIPDDAIIKRPEPETPKGSLELKVKGDQSQFIFDTINRAAVEVFLVDARPLLDKSSDQLVYVNGPVTHDFMTVEDAKKKFVVKKDGTVLYAQRGFDDVVDPEADYDFVDIVKLIELRGKGKSRK